jgi:F-type H+-transporting ATPase subunit b
MYAYLVPAFAEGGTSMLTPDGSLIVTMVLFLVFVPILNKILFQPIGRVLSERDRLTGGSSTEARAILHTIDHKLTAYEEGIRDARSEGYRYVEQRRNEANAERQERIEAARESATMKIAAARADLAADAEAARGRLEADAREISTQISSALLGRAAGGTRR